MRPRLKSAIKIIPCDDEPVPYEPDITSRRAEPADFLDRLAATANTAEALHILGAGPPEVSPDTLREEKTVLKKALKDKSVAPLQDHPLAARAASAFLQAYGRSLAHDVTQVRTALTNKLLELAMCGDPRYELRAIELLGKHSDIGLFTERSEININYSTSEGLEAAIKARVKRLLDVSSALDVVSRPDVSDLDYDPDEYTPYAIVPPEDEEEDALPEPHELPPLDDPDDDDDAGSWG